MPEAVRARFNALLALDFAVFIVITVAFLRERVDQWVWAAAVTRFASSLAPTGALLAAAHTRARHAYLVGVRQQPRQSAPPEGEPPEPAQPRGSAPPTGSSGE